MHFICWGGALRTCGRADRQRGKLQTKFADPVSILPLHAGFGKVRSPHFTPAFDNTKCMEISSVSWRASPPYFFKLSTIIVSYKFTIAIPGIVDIVSAHERHGATH